MGTWDTGIFDNDDALDFVGEIVDDLQGRVASWFEQEEPDIVEGEGLVPPIIYIMHLLSSNCGAAPPKSDLISKWKTRYLKVFDEQIEDLEAEEGFIGSRRETISRTFKQLETISKSFWDGGSKGGGSSGASAVQSKSAGNEDDGEDDENDNDEDDDDETDVVQMKTAPAAASPTSAEKRRFEFIDDKSRKYWEVQLHGKGFTVVYGRIGTAGQTQTKDFPTEEKAQKEYEKLVDEKLKKGYEEIE